MNHTFDLIWSNKTASYVIEQALIKLTNSTYYTIKVLVNNKVDFEVVTEGTLLSMSAQLIPLDAFWILIKFSYAICLNDSKRKKTLNQGRQRSIITLHWHNEPNEWTFLMFVCHNTRWQWLILICPQFMSHPFNIIHRPSHSSHLSIHPFTKARSVAYKQITVVVFNLTTTLQQPSSDVIQWR